MKPEFSSAWIRSAPFDTAFILAPALIVSASVVLLSDRIEQLSALPSWLWLLLVVCVDAGHVYATLFPTYFVREEWVRRHTLLILTPLLVWVGGALIYSAGSHWFWRILAYLALFHFIRQQYGFMMIYARNERGMPSYCRQIDRTAIYMACLYPVMYWHCQGRNFDWFIEGDFLHFNAPWLADIAFTFYLLVLLAYLTKEIRLWRKYRFFNLPRNLLLFGTGWSWYVGIVAFDDDIIFTATNIVAHGLPYYALVWNYGNKQESGQYQGRRFVLQALSGVFRPRACLLYVSLLCILAMLEEGLWDGFIWREHAHLFPMFNLLPEITDSTLATWIVPLLAVPQGTHYLLDAFVWRLRGGKQLWLNV